MPSRRAERTAPDLFSAPSTTNAPNPVSSGKFAGKSRGPRRPRPSLPRDWGGGLKGLDDAEIEALFWAVAGEGGRRTRWPSNPVKEEMAQPPRVPAGHATG